jgi:hypothetical protein
MSDMERSQNATLVYHVEAAVESAGGAGWSASGGAPDASQEEKARILENIPAPVGLPYSDAMKGQLRNLGYLDDDDFRVMRTYLESEEHKPAIFDSEADAAAFMSKTSLCMR